MKIAINGATLLLFASSLTACGLLSSPGGIKIPSEEQGKLGSELTGNTYYLAASMNAGPFFGRGDRLFADPRPAEIIRLYDVEGQALTPPRFEGAPLWAGMKVKVTRVLFPADLAGQPGGVPAAHTWIELERQEGEKGPPILLVLPRDINTAVQFRKLVAGLLGSKAWVDSWLLQRKPDILDAIYAKKVREGMSRAEMFAAYGRSTNAKSLLNTSILEHVADYGDIQITLTGGVVSKIISLRAVAEAERIAAEEEAKKRQVAAAIVAAAAAEKRQKEEAARLAAEEESARLREAKLAREAEEKRERDAETARLAELERQRQEAERKKLEEEQRQQREAEQARIEKERLAKAEADRKAAEKAEKERLAQEEKDRKAAAQAEKERLAQEEKDRKARDKEEKARLAREAKERRAQEKTDAKRSAQDEKDRRAREKAQEEQRARESREAREQADRDAAARAAAEPEERDSSAASGSSSAERDRRVAEEEERRAAAELDKKRASLVKRIAGAEAKMKKEEGRNSRSIDKAKAYLEKIEGMRDEALDKVNVAVAEAEVEVERAKEAQPVPGSKGRVLGLTLEDITPLLQREFGLEDAEGAYVLDIRAAGKANGFAAGDVVFMFNEVKVEDSTQLEALAKEAPLDAPVYVQVIRKGKIDVLILSEFGQVDQAAVAAARGKLEAAQAKVAEAEELWRTEIDKAQKKLTAAEVALEKKLKPARDDLYAAQCELADLEGRPRPPPPVTHANRRKLGLRLGVASADLLRKNHLEGGALVVAVSPGGAAATAGVRANDIIVEFDGRPVVDAGGLAGLAAAAPRDASVPFKVMRNGHAVKLTLYPEGTAAPAVEPAAGAAQPSRRPVPAKRGPVRRGPVVPK